MSDISLVAINLYNASLWDNYNNKHNHDYEQIIPIRGEHGMKFHGLTSDYQYC